MNIVKKIKTVIRYYQAVKKANGLYKKWGLRYYVIYAPSEKKLVPITYDKRVLGQLSYKELRQRALLQGKWLSVTELKEQCLYFTDSKSGAKHCTWTEMFEKMKMLFIIDN